MEQRHHLGWLVRGYLQRVNREPVLHLVPAEVVVGALNERRHAYMPGETYAALVTPLSHEAATELGLDGERIRYRVRLPALALVALNDRLQFRDRDWTVVSVIERQSYVLAVVEAL